jgi:MerR family transcriptional regulator, heat shock protein HspR
MPSLPLDDENLPLFTVGQVSQMLEIQQAFLRRLDQLGVVSPDRSAGNQRRYTRREITVVRYVVDLVDEGMTLAAVRRVLELEALVRDLRAELDALRAAVAERDARLAELSAEPPGRRGSALSPRADECESATHGRAPNSQPRAGHPGESGAPGRGR